MKIEKSDIFLYEDEAPTVPLDEAAGMVFEPASAFGAQTDTEGFPYFEDLSSGVLTPVKTAIFVIGFSRKCDLSVPQDAQTHTVSRFHATVTTRPDGRQFITDESLNGTFFADSEYGPKMRLPKGNETELTDGRIVFFATAAYRFHAGKAPIDEL